MTVKQKSGRAWISLRKVRLAAQSGKCAICELPVVSRPQLDHCHTSGVIRGVLCQNCNHGLGHFKDTPAIMQKAINYLEKWTQSPLKDKVMVADIGLRGQIVSSKHNTT